MALNENQDTDVLQRFGPIGVAALFYSLYITEKHHFNDLWTVVSFVVFASTVVHGFTRYVAAKEYYLKTKNEEKSKNHF